MTSSHTWYQITSHKPQGIIDTVLKAVDKWQQVHPGLMPVVCISKYMPEQVLFAIKKGILVRVIVDEKLRLSQKMIFYIAEAREDDDGEAEARFEPMGEG